jgi:hypothetical protein
MIGPVGAGIGARMMNVVYTLDFVVTGGSPGPATAAAYTVIGPFSATGGVQSKLQLHVPAGEACVEAV